MTLVELRQALLTGQISASELIRRTFSQIDSVNETINAFIETFPDRALLQAQESERRLGTGAARPLEGIPVTVKDCLDIIGSATRCGSNLYRDLRPARAATCVRLLTEAGAILVGKTVPGVPDELRNG